MGLKALRTAQLALLAITNSSKKKNFNSLIFAPLSVVSAECSGNCHFQWKVDETQLNENGSFHVGCIAGIMDVAKVVSSMVLKDGVASSSVKIDLSFMRPAELNELIDIHTCVTKKGKRFVFTSATMINSKGEIIARATQTGSVVECTKDHLKKVYGVIL